MDLEAHVKAVSFVVILGDVDNFHCLRSQTDLRRMRKIVFQ